MSVDMVSNEQEKKKKAQGTMRKLKSPGKHDDSSEEEKGDNMELGGEE